MDDFVQGTSIYRNIARFFALQLSIQGPPGPSTLAGDQQSSGKLALKHHLKNSRQ